MKLPHEEMPFEDPRRTWYADGLRFTCTQCNKCCGGEPGYVWLEDGELERIADFLNLSPRQFARQYCRKVWWRISLLEMTNGDCIFLRPEGCAIYPVRPIQCRTFPFWRDVLRSPRRWEQLKHRCPGVGCGRLYTCEEIQRISRGEQDT
jgi:Fe-S-cluster containining protein